MGCGRVVEAGAGKEDDETETEYSSVATQEDDECHPGLVSFSSNRDLRQVVLEDLQKTLVGLRDPDRLLAFVEEEGFEDVLDDMRAFASDADVQTLGLAIMTEFFRLETGVDEANIAYSSLLLVRIDPIALTDLEEALLASGIVEALALAMLSFAGHLRLQSFALPLFLRFSSPTMMVPSQRLAKVVLSMLTAHVPYPAFVAGALDALYDRANCDFCFRVALAKQGMADVLLLMLQSAQHHPALCRSACRFARLLAYKNPASCKVMAGSGMVDLLVVSVREHFEDASLLVSACKTLGLLAAISDEAKISIARASGVRILVRVLLAYPKRRSVCHSALGALHALILSPAPFMMVCLLRSMADEALAALLLLHRDSRFVTESAAFILWRMQDFVLSLTEEGMARLEPFEGAGR